MATMAIPHVQPLLLIVLLYLFALPALGTPFYKCMGNQKFIEVKSVDISPYPVKHSGDANVTVTGFTSQGIPDGVTINLVLASALTMSDHSYSLCDVTACPVEPGPFVITIPNIFTYIRTKTWDYTVVIKLMEKPLDPVGASMMCVSFACPIARDYASLLSQVTE